MEWRVGNDSPFLNMTKEQLEVCKEVIKMLNRASFTVTGPELVDLSNKLRAFAKVIVDIENNLKKGE